MTGNINITFFLALCTMLAINIFANKEYWKEIFWPEVPLFLKAYPAPVMLMFPVTLAPPGKTGISPMRLHVRMKKNTVSR